MDFGLNAETWKFQMWFKWGTVKWWLEHIFASFSLWNQPSLARNTRGNGAPSKRPSKKDGKEGENCCWKITITVRAHPLNRFYFGSFDSETEFSSFHFGSLPLPTLPKGYIILSSLCWVKLMQNEVKKKNPNSKRKAKSWRITASWNGLFWEPCNVHFLHHSCRKISPNCYGHGKTSGSDEKFQEP